MLIPYSSEVYDVNFSLEKNSCQVIEQYHLYADAVSNTPKRSAGNYSGPTAHIPLKATLARSASRSRNKDLSPREEVIDIDFEDNSQRSPDSDDDLGPAVSVLSFTTSVLSY